MDFLKLVKYWNKSPILLSVAKFWAIFSRIVSKDEWVEPRSHLMVEQDHKRILRDNEIRYLVLK